VGQKVAGGEKKREGQDPFGKIGKKGKQRGIEEHIGRDELSKRGRGN